MDAAEKLPDVLYKGFRLFEGKEVSALVVFVPLHDVVFFVSQLFDLYILGK
ncbi:hypothetical protein [Atopococcus tabaci]|uniref:hypothetical protein n=1 Tax=Atopococcus tabaci TaxID=269774 RepID=UPI001969FCEA|nr:hypothetical protein [Atopococcus tabaci]